MNKSSVVITEKLSRTDRIYAEKFANPVIEFPEFFRYRFEKDNFKNNDKNLKVELNIMFNNMSQIIYTEKEITNEEMKEVMQENIRIIRKHDDPIKKFKRRNFSVSSFYPQFAREECWHFNSYMRYIADYRFCSTHWRKADAIMTAFARQLLENIGYDGIKNMFEKLDLERDQLEEELEICNAIQKNIYKKDFFEIISLIGKDERKNKYELENRLYMNYEQMYLLGIAKTLGTDEETIKDFEEYCQKCEEGKTFESMVEKMRIRMMEMF